MLKDSQADQWMLVGTLLAFNTSDCSVVIL